MLFCEKAGYPYVQNRKKQENQKVYAHYEHERQFLKMSKHQ